MSRSTKAERQIKHFEDGELWSADDATPPANPAGWYVRPRGTSAAWIGPFATEDAANAAPVTGDPLTAARRQLDLWMRSDDSAVRDQTPEPPQAVAVEPEPPSDEPAPPPAQMTFGFDPAPPSAAEARPPRKRRAPRRRTPPPEQDELPF